MAYVKPAAALAGLLAAFTLLSGLSGSAAAQSAPDRVFRGGAEPPARAVEHGVTVVRGQPAQRPEAVPAPVRLAAGDNLWLVDQAKGWLIGCEIVETGFAGRQVVECSSTDLPDIERD